MTQAEAPAALSIVRRLSAPVAEVFAACTEPALLLRWLVPGAGVVSDAALDLRPGGRWRIEAVDPDGVAYAVHGAYLSIAPDQGLETTWTYEGAIAALGGPPSKLSIALRPLAPELTEIVVTHAQLTAQEAADIWRRIWKLCLDRLDASLRPGADDQDLQFPTGALSDIYGDAHRRWQDAFGVRPLANRVRAVIVASELDEGAQGFVASRDFFFLTTVDQRGYPTCSYKGGVPGFVRVVDAKTLAFPVYDGNAMFLSVGNLTANPKVGLLFIDFETPHRTRIHGTASIDRDDPLLADCPGALLIVRVAVAEAFVNCPRYIHRYRRVETSKYAPVEGCTPPVPQWKHIDALQDVLPEHDRAALAAGGGAVITPDEYLEKLKAGEA